VYPGAGEEAIDLLHKILVFNPYFRLSMDECLEHPFFKKVRKIDKELRAENTI
jgi:mitogen-activated protein kinase 1/3